MGKTIERLALGRGYEIVLKITHENLGAMTTKNLQQADVAIEFTRPESAADNLKMCLKAGVPVVCGTTAWLDRLEEVTATCQAENGAFFYASNFSIGVNIFFALNRYLANMMKDYEHYNPIMEEIHHTQKLDAPSGTGITLAEDLMNIITRKQKWVNEETIVPNELQLTSKRLDKVPGTHSIEYNSAIDTIEIKHTAHSREGFALGALNAAEWIIGKKGVFGMSDMLGF
jgi:4-hydroxy-tetrahydrodipicolinate reductase